MPGYCAFLLIIVPLRKQGLGATWVRKMVCTHPSPTLRAAHIQIPHEWIPDMQLSPRAYRA